LRRRRHVSFDLGVYLNGGTAWLACGESEGRTGSRQNSERCPIRRIGKSSYLDVKFDIGGADVEPGGND
jgi:hypothetical protein